MIFGKWHFDIYPCKPSMRHCKGAGVICACCMDRKVSRLVWLPLWSGAVRTPLKLGYVDIQNLLQKGYSGAISSLQCDYSDDDWKPGISCGTLRGHKVNLILTFNQKVKILRSGTNPQGHLSSDDWLRIAGEHVWRVWWCGFWFWVLQACHDGWRW